MNLVWTKLVVILASTLAGERDEGNVSAWGVGGLNLSQWGVLNASGQAERSADDESVCPSSCKGLDAHVALWHVVTPTLIAACVWLVASLPTVLLKSRRRALGVRACLWQLLLLWLNLTLAYALFFRQRVWGYVWAAHSTVHTLTAWVPSRRVLLVPWMHRWLMAFGVAVVCVFAWQVGPPVGLIAWRGGWQSQCGLSAHLMAVLGVDLLGWVLSSLSVVVAGAGAAAF
jgi:hypothetical protein